jgi:hypothetical protein
MAETIKYSGSASVSGGPSLAFSQDIADLDVFTKANLVVPAANGTKTLPFAGTVRLLLVTSSSYTDVKFALDTGTAGTDHDLDMPLLIAGKGALELFAPGLKSVKFTNTNATKAVTLNVFAAVKP